MIFNTRGQIGGGLKLGYHVHYSSSVSISNCDVDPPQLPSVALFREDGRNGFKSINRDVTKLPTSTQSYIV